MSDAESVEGLTRASAYRALTTACSDTGLRADQAELLRLGENAIYKLPSEGVAVRVARADTEDVEEKVTKELAIARWLLSKGFPAVEPRDDLPQPLRAEGRLVTFWEYVPPSRTEPGLVDLARLLRELHSLPEPDFALPALNPFSVMWRRLERAHGVKKRDVEFLREACARSEAEFRDVAAHYPTGLVHGDAHRGNLLARDSRVLLIDYEAVAVGPQAWDLLPTAIAVDRFALGRQDYHAFCRDYGQDVTASLGYQRLRMARELGMTTWLMQNAQSGAAAEEFAIRMESLRKEDRERRWHAL
ncbi:phosphotransferase enzyme family protein [Streptomyces endophytica]|uniref:Phosphotransferase n=1 Tax=Streptomyces endophytica TaxID=2991496 RepID=A0ABY6PJD7_9ACTN|nr:phosphotransferase [Streptomyces endophytica]UZJ33475.1 phosphotransferase [Streptomyces endophytica]